MPQALEPLDHDASHNLGKTFFQNEPGDKIIDATDPASLDETLHAVDIEKPSPASQEKASVFTPPA